MNSHEATTPDDGFTRVRRLRQKNGVNLPTRFMLDESSSQHSQLHSCPASFPSQPSPSYEVLSIITNGERLNVQTSDDKHTYLGNNTTRHHPHRYYNHYNILANYNDDDDGDDSMTYYCPTILMKQSVQTPTSQPRSRDT